MGSNVSAVTRFWTTVNEGFVSTIGGSGVSSGATTVPLTQVNGLVNGTVFVGLVDPGTASQQTFTGTVDVPGLRITNVKWTRGNNTDHLVGATVVDYVTGTDINMLARGMEKQHKDDGTHKDVTADNLTVSGSTTFLGGVSGVTTSSVKNSVAFNVYLGANVPNWTQNSANTKIPFNTKAFDLGNNYNTTTRVFTAPVNGYYQFNTTLCVLNANNGGYLGADWIFGSAARALGEVAMSTLSGVTTISGSKFTYMLAGETLAINCFSSVANLAIGGNANESSRTCYFSGYLVATP